MYEQYVYYYIRGEAYLHVLDVIGGGEERLPLDENVVQETEGDENRDRALHFGLQIDEQNGEIWLYYSVTDAPRKDALTVREEREQVPYYAWQQLVWSADFTSILALEPLLRRYPEYSVIAYEGDGFLYLDYTNLSIDEHGWSPDNLFVVLEDYDSGTFYRITHNDPNFDSDFHVKKETHPLAADAREKTLAMLRTLNIPIEKATMDYRTRF